VERPRRSGLLPDQWHAPTQVGKYAILPTTCRLENGWYACSVAISSGQGRNASERVLRLTRLLLRLFTPGARLRFGLFDGGN